MRFRTAVRRPRAMKSVSDLHLMQVRDFGRCATEPTLRVSTFRVLVGLVAGRGRSTRPVPSLALWSRAVGQA